TVSPGVELAEMGFVLEDGGDGRFDAADYLLFYGEPTVRWEYDGPTGQHLFRQNPYTLDNVYWLDLDGPAESLRVRQRRGALTEAAPLRPSRYRERIHEEDERYILRQLLGINSGYDWYWEDFQGKARNYSFVIADAVADPVDVRVRFWGWSAETHRFDVRWNDVTVGRATFSGTAASTVERRANGGATEGLNQVGLVHLGTELTKLDWIEVEYSRRLVALGGELAFAWVDAVRDTAGAPVSGAAEFALTGFAGQAPRVFDVADSLVEVVDLVHDPGTGALTFQDRWDGARQPPRYVVMQPDRWRRPASISLDQPSDLRRAPHGADWVAIAHADFADAARRLAAWRSEDDRFGPPMRAATVDVQDIYDEFSGGLVDPMAIRSFVRYAADHWEPAPAFVLLVGDASLDYKNNTGTSHPNWMPAYQDGISMYDEWYVRVDADILPDLAIGRLPVQTAAQADGVVDKIVEYEREPEVGPWRSRNLLISDDLDNPQYPDDFESYFLVDAESMARRLLPLDLDLIKLYLGTYPLEGRTKPQARDEFIRLFSEGNLLVTYLGHGNPETLAHEQMFVLSRDIGAIANGHRWPFMYTAASQVGVFDDWTRQSMPEVLLNQPDRGVVGFISATRVGFHNSNMILARQFYEIMFRSGQLDVPVGPALTAAKQIVQPLVDVDSQINIQRYSLLGDPALRLSRPRNRVVLEMPDTLRALEEVPIQGRVEDADGTPLDDLAGTAWLQVFDSAASADLEGQPYIQLGAPIFRCFVEVQGGRFRARLRVPKDITYRGTRGRASAYVWSDAGTFGHDNCAFGAVQDIALAGTAEGVEVDDTGPAIALGFRGQTGFSSGDFVAPSPVLEAFIGDPNGINITGETGHEIVLLLDGDTRKVTEYYHNTGGDYRTGVLEYPLPALEPGTHTVSLKAWDTHNNSARVEAEVRVAEEGDRALADLLFYPNPMDGDSGFFTYILAAPAQQVRIRVFSLAGTLVDELAGEHRLGYNQVAWTPPTELSNGTYLYEVSVTLETDERLERADRIQVLR
ncbi:MAG: type IX secretion system sortase PorU, partial [Gemmatimonadota bacterium]